MVSRFRGRLIVPLLILLAASSVYAQTYKKELGTGVTLTQQVIASPDAAKPEVINIITVDPKAPGVRVQAVVGGDRVMGTDATKGREIVSSVAKRLSAVAVVNADFFPYTGDMLNLHVSGGELISEPNPQRMVFGITSDGRLLADKVDLDAKVTLPEGKIYPIRIVNGPRSLHKLTIYTRKFADTTGTNSQGSEAVVKCDIPALQIGTPITGIVQEVRAGQGDTPISEGCIVLSGSGTGQQFIDESLKVGMTITMQFKLKPTKTESWDKVVEAVGGGPCLVADGKVNVDGKEENFIASFYASRHPRTAIGSTADGKIIIVTVDGRQSISVGMTLPQLADEMLSLGCVQAINLDGGGSTTMATSFGILNSPCEGLERPVANMLAVFATPISQDAPEFAIQPNSEPLIAGKTTRFTLVDKAGKPISEDMACKAVWTTGGGAGFVDQSGTFYGLRSKRGNLSARLGSRIVSLPIEIVSCEPTSLSVKFDPDPSGSANRNIITVTVKNSSGKAVPNQVVTIKVTGGTTDLSTPVTDQSGNASTGIDWNPDPAVAGLVDVSCQGSASTIIQRPEAK